MSISADSPSGGPTLPRLSSIPSTDLISILYSGALLGCVFSAVIALTSLKPLLIGSVLRRNSAVLGISIAVSVYKSNQKASKPFARQMGTASRAGEGHCGRYSVLGGIHRLAVKKGEDTHLGSVAECICQELGSEDLLGRFRNSVRFSSIYHLSVLRCHTALLSFDTTANECLHFTDLAFKFLLSPQTT